MFAARAMSKAVPAGTAVASRAAVGVPTRGMAAGGAAPKYTGFEAKVRAKLPKDEHMVVGILGFYAGLYVVVKGVSAVFSSPKKEVAPVPAAVVPTTGSHDIPAGDEFWHWIDGPGNLDKYLATLEKST